MFKLESYVTPIILSYVDKYVKNARADKSQVSYIQIVIVNFANCLIQNHTRFRYGEAM